MHLSAHIHYIIHNLNLKNPLKYFAKVKHFFYTTIKLSIKILFFYILYTMFKNRYINAFHKK
jgi:hypothetical protein